MTLPESTEQKLARAFRRLAVAVIGSFVVVTVLAVDDPQVPLLVNTGHGVWITADEEIDLGTRLDHQIAARFRRRFEIPRAATRGISPPPTLEVRALGRFRVLLDGRPLAEVSLHGGAQTPRAATRAIPVELPGLGPGRHELLVAVRNHNGPAALWIDSPRPELRSSREWESSTSDGTSWRPARRADRPQPAAISRRFPTTGEALLRVLPWLLPLFVAGVLFARRRESAAGIAQAHGRRSAGLDHAKQVRDLLLLTWTLLAVHNLVLLPAHVGFDVPDHLAYIRYLAEQRHLPRSGDGWQTFQSPLYYALNAPLYALLADWMSPASIVKLLRTIPLLCGLAQIEIVYRIGRRVFPANQALQSISLIVGGWMPMSIAVSQTIGNEPLAGCLTALTILLAVRSFDEPEPTPRTFAGIGLVWGLAMLTKVTPVLLGPALAVGVFVHSRRTGRGVLRSGANVLALFAAATAVCGWYYVQNWVVEGRPFTGGWDPSRGIVWWQYPGFRTPQQMLSFGRSLVQPVYSGVYGLWDGLYSTIWTDGFLSGVTAYDVRPPWNETYLVSAALLAVVPTLLILAGFARAMFASRALPAGSRSATAFAAVCLLTWLAAVASLYFRVPIYSAAKGSYLLGLLPCFGLLAAAGAEPLLRSRTASSLLAGFLVCWLVTVSAAFFV